MRLGKDFGLRLRSSQSFPRALKGNEENLKVVLTECKEFLLFSHVIAETTAAISPIDTCTMPFVSTSFFETSLLEHRNINFLNFYLTFIKLSIEKALIILNK
jgi:hypothetical protein